MKKRNYEIMKRILYAVETGGQVYGRGRYDDVTVPYTNSSAEHSITIGAGAWYGSEAKRLLQTIQSADPSRFEVMDTAGIERDLQSADWNRYSIGKDSKKAQCISKIISSLTGIVCQDTLMLKQIGEYELEIRERFGKMPDTAMMECVNIRHQGGMGAVKRILEKTEKPYTLETIYAALNTDPADKMNNNQVGDYVTRQKRVYEMIREHSEEEMQMTEYDARMKMVNTMNEWIGRNRADGTHMSILNIYNAHRPLARGYKVQPRDAYCATTVSAAAIKNKYTDIIPTECGCGQMIALFQAIGRWVENDGYVPEVGDIIFYDWNDVGNGDCKGWPEHVGVVVAVNKETRKMVITEGNTAGGRVGQRSITINARYIRGYGVPDYAKKATASPGSQKPQENKPQRPSTGGINKTPKWTGSVIASELNVRSWAGTENPKIKSWPVLSHGDKVDVCDTINDSTGKPWHYVRIAGKFYGFVSAKYIAEKPTENIQKPKVEYTVGQTYTLQVELKVRTAPGTGSATKSYSQLTMDGKRHDNDRDGCLDPGTQVTCQDLKIIGGDIWLKAPSGWMAAYYKGQRYIK